MTRRMVLIIALIYTIFGMGFWAVYNLRLDLAGEKLNVPVHDFATVNFDNADQFGRAEFTEQGSDGFVEIQLPDGWVKTEDMDLSGSVAFEKENVVVIFSGYSVPQPREKTIALVDELMMTSVHAEKKELQPENKEWCEYVRKDNPCFKTGAEQYYINVHGDANVSYVTVVESYVPDKITGSGVVEDFLKGCNTDAA